jgi:hypothetical protein
MKVKKAITIDEEILNKLLVLCDKEDRNLSNQINKILKDYFDKLDR